MTEADYNAIPGVRWSRLREMAKSPLHYAFAVKLPDYADSAAKRLGRAIDAAVIEPKTFSDRFVTWTGKTKTGKTAQKRGKEWVAFQSKALLEGKEILTQAESTESMNAAAAIRRHRLAERYIRSGWSQHVVRWTDEKTGLPCKARIDRLSPAWMIELKSTARVSPRQFLKTSAGFFYHAQIAFYLDGLEAAEGLKPEPIVIVVESGPPHDVIVYRVPEETLVAGRRHYRSLLDQVAWCAQQDEWPGHAPKELVPLDLPAWALGEDGVGDLELDGESVF